jgi:hypothetical protein
MERTRSILAEEDDQPNPRQTRPADRREMRVWSQVLLEKDAEPIDPQPLSGVGQVVLKIDVLTIGKNQLQQMIVKADYGECPHAVLAANGLQEERIPNLGTEEAGEPLRFAETLDGAERASPWMIDGVESWVGQIQTVED